VPARAGAEARIRDAEPADAPAVGALARIVWPATYRGLLEDDFIDLVLERTYRASELEAQIRRAAASDDEHFLVADAGEHLLGYLHYGPATGLPELYRLYVHPAESGRGLGRALLAELHRRLEPGTTYVALVHAGNTRALRFYERQGFERAGRVDGKQAFLERYGIAGGGSADPCDILLRFRIPGPA
jgi:ribosomal protein S18 acetylase RimI-like enzyme